MFIVPADYFGSEVLDPVFLIISTFEKYVLFEMQSIPRVQSTPLYTVATSN